METCKNCGKSIRWASNGAGQGFAWFHIETAMKQCFPNIPQAEPVNNVTELFNHA